MVEYTHPMCNPLTAKRCIVPDPLKISNCFCDNLSLSPSKRAKTKALHCSDEFEESIISTI